MSRYVPWHPDGCDCYRCEAAEVDAQEHAAAQWEQGRWDAECGWEPYDVDEHGYVGRRV